MSCRSDKPGRKWYTTEQHAGDLVKIQKCVRPRLSKNDDAFTRTEKNAIIKASKSRDSALSRHPADRCELMVALMGRDSTHYVLKYTDEFLPPTWKAIRQDIKLFTRRIKHIRRRPVDWIVCPEGRHGEGKYHIHIILRNKDFCYDDVVKLWGKGSVWEEPVLKFPGDRYRRLGKYFTKEPRDGIKLPIGSRQWSCSRSLSAKLPKPIRYMSDSGHIDIPMDASVCATKSESNAFGFYNYVSFQLPHTSRARARACDDI